MKIYTSYFGNIKRLKEAGVMPVCISKWKPKFYQGSVMSSVAPTRYMLSDECSTEEYIKLYEGILTRLGANNIYNEIKSISKGNDVALICYEKPGDFCHRHLLSDFLNRNLNLDISEFVSVEPKKQIIQTSLFD